MIIESFNVEFGYELISVVPYAYWNYVNGILESTKSGFNSESLYYFSPKHELYTENRSWDNMAEFRKSDLPNKYIHQPKLNTEKFLIPPYKEIYKNDIFKYDKPIICICNRYNKEWGREPINYFSLECLKTLFEELQDKYQIVYIASNIPEAIQDSAHSMELGDYEFAKQYPKVIVFQDLVKDSWNETLLKVFANCEKFITMNGGYSILASFFGGQNIIYSKPGNPETREIKNGSFWRWYPEFANSQIIYTSSYKELYRSLIKFEIPTVNILIRTHQRPNYFKDCIESIKAQTYQNINVIVGVEKNDTKTINYAYSYPYRIVHYSPQTPSPAPEQNENYGRDFPYNQYLNILTQKAPNGYIIYLDDDDTLTSPTAIEEMIGAIKNHDLLYWKVDCKSRLVPNEKHWQEMEQGGLPTVCDVSGIGFMFHTRLKDHIDWGYWKRGDFRVASTLHKLGKSKCVNKVFTAIQDKQHGGANVDKVIKSLRINKTDTTNFWLARKQEIKSKKLV